MEGQSDASSTLPALLFDQVSVIYQNMLSLFS